MKPSAFAYQDPRSTIPAAACVISAIEDALRPNAPPITMHPVSPERILEWINKTKR